MFNIGDKVMIKGGKYKHLEGVVTKIKEISADVKIGSIYCRLMIDDLEKIDAPYTVDEVFEVAEEGDIFEIEDINEGRLRFEYRNSSLFCITDGDYFYTFIEERYSMKDIMKMKFVKIVEYSKLKINKKDLDNIVKLLKDNGYNYEIEEV